MILPLLFRAAFNAVTMNLIELHLNNLIWQNRVAFPSNIGTRMDAGTLKKEFKVATLSAGLHYFLFHDLRHTQNLSCLIMVFP